MSRIGSTELIELFLSFMVLTLAFSARGMQLPSANMLIISAIGVGSGFMLHELAHKFVAQRFGYWAEYKASPMGLILTLVMAMFIGIVFAAPGAVMIRKSSYTAPQSTYSYGDTDDSYWDRLERKSGGEELWISLAGPITNIILAAFFFAMIMSGVLSSGGLLLAAATYGIYINLMLAAFNLIPIDPLDGGKIFRGNAIIWAIVAVPTILLALGLMFGGFSLF